MKPLGPDHEVDLRDRTWLHALLANARSQPRDEQPGVCAFKGCELTVAGASEVSGDASSVNEVSRSLPAPAGTYLADTLLALSFTRTLRTSRNAWNAMTIETKSATAGSSQ